MRALIMFLVSAVVLFPLTADAIDVSGDQWGTWTRDNSPYNVVGEIRVPPESTLVIEPGIVVNFQGHYKFIVDSLATLVAIGTETDSIYFTTEDTATGWHGVRFLYADSISRISYCLLEYGRTTGSWPEAAGGAVFCYYSSPTITDNTIRRNIAVGQGGGICCRYSNASISNNTIAHNSAVRYGGGICCFYSAPPIANNTISGNSVDYQGGGIFCGLSNPAITNNTISGNSADKGGGVWCGASTPIITNTILWRDTAGIDPEIRGDAIVTYCDVQGGWQGQGNINADPLFADPEQGDFHLEWGSPCIDAGDPNSPPDPDGTRADMGAFYFPQGPFWPKEFDFSLLIGQHIQKVLLVEDPYPDTLLFSLSCDVEWIGFLPDSGSVPPDSCLAVEVTFDATCLPLGPNQATILVDILTPYQAQCQIPVTVRVFSTEYTYISLTPDTLPIVIPPEGGSFSYWAHTYNATDFTYRFDVWIDAILPGGQTYGPIYKKRDFLFRRQQSTGYHLTQYVPGYAPAGGYSYNCKMGVFPDQVDFVDSFGFMKIDTGLVAGGVPVGSWDLVGWEEELIASLRLEQDPAALIPTEYSLSQNYPNPFNATTIIEYELPKPCWVRLEVFNLRGQRVDVLTDGWERPGSKAVRWDRQAASGIYFYRLTAGDFTDTKRMLLVK
jgi:parallel beta-helix repeat protein